jgi:hypothetical protein
VQWGQVSLVVAGWQVVSFLLDFHDGRARWDGDLEEPYGQGPATMYWDLRFGAVMTSVIQLRFVFDVVADEAVTHSCRSLPSGGQQYRPASTSAERIASSGGNSLSCSYGKYRSSSMWCRGEEPCKICI